MNRSSACTTNSSKRGSEKPDEVIEERIFDIALTLHANHELKRLPVHREWWLRRYPIFTPPLLPALPPFKGPLDRCAKRSVMKMLLERLADKAMDVVKPTL